MHYIPGIASCAAVRRLRTVVDIKLDPRRIALRRLRTVFHPSRAGLRNDIVQVSFDSHVHVTVLSGWSKLILVSALMCIDLIVPHFHEAFSIAVVSDRESIEAFTSVESLKWYYKESIIIGPWVKAVRNLSDKCICPIRVVRTPQVVVTAFCPGVANQQHLV